MWLWHIKAFVIKAFVIRCRFSKIWTTDVFRRIVFYLPFYIGKELGGIKVLANN